MPKRRKVQQGADSALPAAEMHEIDACISVMLVARDKHLCSGKPGSLKRAAFLNCMILNLETQRQAL